MSKHDSTELTLRVADNDPGTHVTTQYGVRLPNGKHQWDSVEGGGRRVNLQGMLDPGTAENNRALWRQHWQDYLEGQAKFANLDVDEYGALHQFVKRTVILAVTVPEEV